MTLPPPKHLLFTLAMLALGALGGEVLALIGTPLPYMLGSLLVTAALTMAFQTKFPTGYSFPMGFRQIFVGIIGVMIGAQVSPDLVAMLPSLTVSVPAILLFVVLAQTINYQLFRRVGGYSRPTAFFSGSPGGLVESITFGEESGADIRILTLLQFLRIILVVSLLPIGISIYEGAPVGSASGQVMNGAGSDIWDVVLTLIIAPLGGWIGAKLKIPTAHLAGPLVIVGIASATGLISLQLPGWLVAAAQIVMGTGLGIKFTGITRRMMMTGLGLSFVSVTLMMTLGAGMAYGVSRLTGLDFETLLISFAPGGVTEMSLVALSLAISPTFVTLHHLIRIMVTVVALSVIHKTGRMREPDPT